MNFAAPTFCPTKSLVRSIVVGALHPFSTPRSPPCLLQHGGRPVLHFENPGQLLLHPCRNSSTRPRCSRAVVRRRSWRRRAAGGRAHAGERAGRVQLPGDHPDCGRASKRVARMRQVALAERNFFWAHATNSFAKFCMSSNSGGSSRAPIPIHSLTKSAHTLPAMP